VECEAIAPVRTLGAWTFRISIREERLSCETICAKSFKAISNEIHTSIVFTLQSACLGYSFTPFLLVMSFLFGGGRPQPSSAEKIAAAEAEIEMVSDMFNRYILIRQSLSG